jgi:hypothetical protein
MSTESGVRGKKTNTNALPVCLVPCEESALAVCLRKIRRSLESREADRRRRTMEKVKGMKRSTLKSFALVLSILAGGTIANTQAADVHLYDVNFGFQNATPICAVYGLPEAVFTGLSVNVLDYQILDSSVDVDGAGKLTGFAQVQVTTEDGTSVVMANVSGAMGMKGNYPVVNMNIKGTGFGTGAVGNGKSSLNIKFTGSPVYIGVRPGTASTYENNYEMQGTIKGSFNPGIKGVKAINIKNADAYIPSYNVSGLTAIESCSLNLVDVNNTWTLGGCTDNADGDLDLHYEWTGSGKANWNGTFNMSLKGTGGLVGSQITLKGIAIDDTVNSDNVGGKVFTSLSASGKILGQKVSSTDGGGSLGHVDVTDAK